VITAAYIGGVRSEAFGYYVPGDWNGHMPGRLSERVSSDRLYWDIVRDVLGGAPGTRHTD